MKNLVFKNWSFVIVLCLILLGLVFQLLVGENIVIQVHDNLDACVPLLKMLSANNLWFEFHSYVPYLHNIDRNYTLSEYKLLSVLFMIFPTFKAYLTVGFVRIFISVFGFLYLANAINDELFNKHIFVFAGFLYALTPVFPNECLSFAGVPVIIALLINFYKTYKFKYLIFLFLATTISSFSFFGFFIISFLIFFIPLNWLVKKQVKLSMCLPVISLTFGFIFTEWRLFYLMLFEHAETIRKIFSNYHNSLNQILPDAFNVFINGYYHSGSLHCYVVLPCCILFLIYLNFKYIKNQNYKAILKDYYNWCFLLIIFNCLVYALDDFRPFINLISSIIHPLKGFSFARTLWFNPFLWYFLFAVALSRFNIKNMKYEKYINLVKYLICLGAFLVFFFANSTYNIIKQNYDFYRHQIEHKQRTNHVLTYKEFFSVDLFEKIKKDINYNGEWSIAFGIHPSILQYNNIKTLDGYNSMMPLDYHYQFRKLIEPQLERCKKNANYFDKWGGRAYIFSKDITHTPEKKYKDKEINLYIDKNIFKQMDGTYVFSRVKITNANNLDLNLVGKYSDKNSPYTIYVYRIK